MTRQTKLLLLKEKGCDVNIEYHYRTGKDSRLLIDKIGDETFKLTTLDQRLAFAILDELFEEYGVDK